MSDKTFIERLDDFLLEARGRIREGLENRVVSPFARETIKRALESGSNDRVHDALVLVAEELGIDWTAKEVSPGGRSASRRKPPKSD